jgi:hypothetical protein
VAAQVVASQAVLSSTELVSSFETSVDLKSTTTQDFTAEDGTLHNHLMKHPYISDISILITNLT